MSALLTTTMPMMAESVIKLKAELKPVPIILIGGAPVTQEYADKIGASGYAGMRRRGRNWRRSWHSVEETALAPGGDRRTLENATFLTSMLDAEARAGSAPFLRALQFLR